MNQKLYIKGFFSLLKFEFFFLRVNHIKEKIKTLSEKCILL